MWSRTQILSTCSLATPTELAFVLQLVPPWSPRQLLFLMIILDSFLLSSPKGFLSQESWGLGFCTSSLPSTLRLQKVTWSDSSWHTSEAQGPSPVPVLRINSHLELKTIHSSGWDSLFLPHYLGSPLPWLFCCLQGGLLLLWAGCLPRFRLALLTEQSLPWESHPLCGLPSHSSGSDFRHLT